MEFDPTKCDTIDFARLVAEAREHFAIELMRKELQFRARAARRKRLGLPTFGFMGAGKSGKDAAAEIVVARCNDREKWLGYGGSTSWACAPMVAYSMGVEIPESAYRVRRRIREFWFRWLSEFRRYDPTAVVRLHLAEGDVCVGIRGKRELVASVESEIVTLPIWIERDGFQDGVHEMDKQLVLDCGGRVLENAGTLADLEHKIVILLREFGVPFSKQHVHSGGG